MMVTGNFDGRAICEQKLCDYDCTSGFLVKVLPGLTNHATTVFLSSFLVDV